MSATKTRAIFIFRENASAPFFIRGVTFPDGDKDTWDATLDTTCFSCVGTLFEGGIYVAVFLQDATNLCFDLNLPSDGPSAENYFAHIARCCEIIFRITAISVLKPIPDPQHYSHRTNGK